MSSKKLHAGVINAINDIGKEILKIIEKGHKNKLSEDQIKLNIQDYIENYIEEKIVLAHDSMIHHGVNLISKHRKETIMVIGHSNVFQSLFQRAKEEGRDFTVIVVDTCPGFGNRGLLQKLS